MTARDERDLLARAGQLRSPPLSRLRSQCTSTTPCCAISACRAAKSDRGIKANLDELTNQGLQFGVDRLAFACRFLTQVRNEAPPQRVERSYTILREGKDG
jgi:hypothetical protein